MLKTVNMFIKIYMEMKEDQATLVKNNEELTRSNYKLIMCVGEVEQYSRDNLKIKGVSSTQEDCCTAIIKQIEEKVRFAVVMLTLMLYTVFLQRR